MGVDRTPERISQRDVRAGDFVGYPVEQGMLKFWATYYVKEDGRVPKGPGYDVPDVVTLLERQAPSERTVSINMKLDTQEFDEAMNRLADAFARLNSYWHRSIAQAANEVITGEVVTGPMLEEKERRARYRSSD